MIKKTLFEQEPDVITYEVPIKKIRTHHTETTKPVQQFRNAINPPKHRVIQQDSVADCAVYVNLLHIDPDPANKLNKMIHQLNKEENDDFQELLSMAVQKITQLRSMHLYNSIDQHNSVSHKQRMSSTS